MRNRLLVLVLALGLVAFACGGDGDSDVATSTESPSEEGSMDMDDDMDMDDEGMFAVGEPAEAAEADREIEVVAKDDFSYEPPVIEVAVGETVRFVVTNEGKIVHEFVLGDEEFQDEHEQEMAEMDEHMVHDGPYAVDLDPDETKELTWRFTNEGEFLYACHEPGHYDAGMIGTIVVR